MKLTEIRDKEAVKYVELISPKYGKFKFIVDAEDYEKIKSRSWVFKKEHNHYNYAITEVSLRPNRKQLYLHRFITNAPASMVVDHINGNTLDNRKSNLRVCTISVNSTNRRRKRKNATSKYYGVSFNGGSWRAKVIVNKKGIHLGTFKKEIDAAIEYNKALIKYDLIYCVKNDFTEINNLIGES